MIIQLYQIAASCNQRSYVVQASHEAAAVLALNVEPAKTKASNVNKSSKGAVPNKRGVSVKPVQGDGCRCDRHSEAEVGVFSLRHQEPSEQQVQD